MSKTLVLNGQFVVDISADVATTEQLSSGQLVSLRILRTEEESGRKLIASQPKSLDWRNRHAGPHQSKKIPLDAFAQACVKLNTIIQLR